MHEHHVTCQEIVELITDYLERALDAETAALFEEHINFCDGCEAYLGQMRVTIAAVGSFEDFEEPPPDVRWQLMRDFQEFQRR
jgi:hypothetical protein